MLVALVNCGIPYEVVGGIVGGGHARGGTSKKLTLSLPSFEDVRNRATIIVYGGVGTSTSSSRINNHGDSRSSSRMWWYIIIPSDNCSVVTMYTIYELVELNTGLVWGVERREEEGLAVGVDSRGCSGSTESGVGIGVVGGGLWAGDVGLGVSPGTNIGRQHWFNEEDGMKVKYIKTQ